MSFLIYLKNKASLIALFFIIVFVFILISINLFGIAFKKLGFPPEYSIYFIFLSLLGGYANIPIKRVISRVPITPDLKFDCRCRNADLPAEIKRSTLIAINMGGAVIPVLMSGFLFTMVSIIEVLIGIIVVAVIIHKIAKPVKGSGIAIHALFPPVLAAAVALMISPHNAPIIAYISGTLGCLIGIDILNFKKIPDLGVPVVSVGGAGTFDAIFLTGIISVLLA